jgi:hypothetical protein
MPQLRGLMSKRVLRWPTAGLALVIALRQAGSIDAQGLPVDCQTALTVTAGNAHLRKTGANVSPLVIRLARKLELMLQEKSIDDPTSFQEVRLTHDLEALVARDSSGIKDALSYLIVSSDVTGSTVAFNAAAFYRHAYGDAQHLLDWLFAVGNSERRGIVLSAISSPLSEASATEILAFACDAYWRLKTLQDDTTYFRLWQSAPIVRWPFEVKAILLQSQTALSGGSRSTVKDMIEAINLSKF